MKIRTGFGYDVHRLEEGREFWLGGVVIPYEKGALGHSDADVLIHAICDALLGAVNKRDIGFHFPDTDPRFKNVDSKILLEEVVKIIRNDQWKICNIDSTICLEKPKVNPFIPEMKKTMTKVMKIDEEELSIKATTSEKMGFVGKEEGITAYAVVLLMKE
ncbi:MAG: 2-C-methyl-D-erythritol 2,4-cyclodiphosphate synthase [Cyclobacteriaceae bacterium]|nr:2-C-methyl-D-erythritol 2,4-cyclodiphosphate synthase [Cyclobacteriaceae bacterium]